MAIDPKQKVEVSDDGSRVDVFTPDPGTEPHSHDVFHTAADGWTTHDYGRSEANDEPYVNSDKGQGNVISGSEQYD